MASQSFRSNILKIYRNCANVKLDKALAYAKSGNREVMEYMIKEASEQCAKIHRCCADDHDFMKEAIKNVRESLKNEKEHEFLCAETNRMLEHANRCALDGDHEMAGHYVKQAEEYDAAAEKISHLMKK